MSGFISSVFEKVEEATVWLGRRMPLPKVIVEKQYRLKSFVLIAVLFVSFISFNSAYLITSGIYRNILQEQAFEVSNAISQQVLGSMLQLMDRGWTRKELNKFLSSLNGMEGQLPYSVDIYRGPAVEALFGVIPRVEMATDVKNVFSTGKVSTARSGYTIKNIYPVKARQDCLGCHTNAKDGEVLGVVEVRQDTKSTLVKAEKKIAFIFLLLLPVPLLMSFIIVVFINARIKSSTELFHDKIKDISSVRDLTKLELENINLGFEEFNQILLEIDKFVKKMKDVAVDKRILEFELEVLEKFIITSEVVRDWKDHVAHLLIEVNKVIDAYTLFSIFQVGDETYELEIFWINKPTETTQERVERIIRHKITSENARFSEITTIRISHNIAIPSQFMTELEEEDIQLQTKSLILKTPQIGGVVGIGVQSQMTEDPIRSLVIDGILTTLLNVVGSIKAIYKYTQDMEFYATRDPLTNLYNQRIFWEMLGYEIGRAQRHGYKFCLLVIDLDDFKKINDAHGHVFGDKFLSGMAGKMQEALRQGDILARYGGDEFVAVLPEADEEQAFLVAGRITDGVAQLSLKADDGAIVKATISIGLGVYPYHAATAKDLFMFADNMMYKAKSKGKNTMIIPSEDDVMEIFRQTGEKTLIVTSAIEDKTLIPYFQPVINVNTGEIFCHEVLSRIKTDAGIMNASEFIEVAEKLGVVNRLDYVLMEKVFEKAKKEGYNGSLFINLSPKSLILKEFIPRVMKLSDEYGMDRSKIVFEITERDTVRNISILEKFVINLKFEGFMFAVDDFGAGFSSFNYIKRFPIDYIKIEGDFIRNMIADHKDMAFVKTISILAKEFNIRTIAAYVENDAVLQVIKKVGIDYGQGFYIGKPTPDLMTSWKGKGAE